MDIFCFYCGKRIDNNGPIIYGSLLTDGNKNIVQPVAGGIIYGKQIGYVCDNCSAFNKNKERS